MIRNSRLSNVQSNDMKLKVSMKIKRWRILLILITLAINSCIVVNKTKYKADEGVYYISNECSKHKCKMHKAIVGTAYGLLAYEFVDPSYPNARRKASMGCIVDHWPLRRLAIVYVCKECNRMKRSGK